MFGLRLLRIEGRSMEPILAAGDFALFQRKKAYRPGDVVLLDHPRFGRIVKEIVEIKADRVVLRGISSASVSSEAMGQIPIHNIVGRLFWQLSKSPKETYA